MRKHVLNCQRFLLVAVYCFVAFVGLFLTIEAIFYCGNSHSTIKCVTSERSQPGRASWVQNRHIPAFPKMVTKPSVASIQLNLPEPDPWQYLDAVQPHLPSCSFKYFRFLPRDPPSA